MRTIDTEGCGNSAPARACLVYSKHVEQRRAGLPLNTDGYPPFLYTCTRRGRKEEEEEFKTHTRKHTVKQRVFRRAPHWMGATLAPLPPQANHPTRGVLRVKEASVSQFVAMCAGRKRESWFGTGVVARPKWPSWHCVHACVRASGVRACVCVCVHWCVCNSADGHWLHLGRTEQSGGRAQYRACGRT